MATYVFNITPIGKPRQTREDKWKQRPAVLRYRDFADEIRRQASAQNFQLTNGLTYTFYISMPDSWSDKRKAQYCSKLHDQRPDLDNLIKSVWDALAKEDKAIAHIAEAKKVWAYKPGIVITKG